MEDDDETLYPTQAKKPLSTDAGMYCMTRDNLKRPRRKKTNPITKVLRVMAASKVERIF
jgi:hypothetical protein